MAAIFGELDLTGAAETYVRATSLLGDHPDFIVDLSGVTFCDSTGFNALLRLRRRVMKAEGWLAVAAPPAQIGRLLTLGRHKGGRPSEEEPYLEPCDRRKV